MEVAFIVVSGLCFQGSETAYSNAQRCTCSKIHIAQEIRSHAPRHTSESAEIQHVPGPAERERVSRLKVRTQTGNQLIHSKGIFIGRGGISHSYSQFQVLKIAV